MISISPTNEKILRNLAKYKYLSTEQIKRLIKVKHKQQVYENLKLLREKGLVDSVIYGAVSRV
jgi:Fe2+ or Zn2+ uptake regulation protein